MGLSKRVMTGVISTLSGVILLITLLTKSHEPLSRVTGRGLGFRR